jgi:hypothetical protein
MIINSIYDILRKTDTEQLVITKKSTSEKTVVDTNAPTYADLLSFYLEAKVLAPTDRKVLDTTLLENYFDGTSAPSLSNEELTTIGLENLMKFFTEFQFEPNFRFVNSLSLALSISREKATNYICNYFELIDSPYAREICEKVKSAEFKEILANLGVLTPTKTVNNRFKLYYGSQGTGKTTKAMVETNGRCMVCNNSMLPSDLMEDFVFDNGQATFKPSALWRSMVDGTPIVLDEINLLPFDSLRFLQTILDGKTEFLYKGNTVKIADGFKIIGTMNLTVNGMTYGLPEPLVDRAEDMQKFTLSAKDLLKAII